MAAASSIISGIIAAAVVAGSAVNIGYTVDQANRTNDAREKEKEAQEKANKILEQQAKDQEATNDELISIAEKEQEQALNELDRRRKAEQEKEDASSATSAQSMARQRQRALATGGTSRRDTILTSPLGIVEQPQTRGKTLLGV